MLGTNGLGARAGCACMGLCRAASHNRRPVCTERRRLLGQEAVEARWVGHRLLIAASLCSNSTPQRHPGPPCAPAAAAPTVHMLWCWRPPSRPYMDGILYQIVY